MPVWSKFMKPILIIQHWKAILLLGLSLSLPLALGAQDAEGQEKPVEKAEEAETPQESKELETPQKALSKEQKVDTPQKAGETQKTEAPQKAVSEGQKAESSPEATDAQEDSSNKQAPCDTDKQRRGLSQAPKICAAVFPKAERRPVLRKAKELLGLPKALQEPPGRFFSFSAYVW